MSKIKYTAKKVAEKVLAAYVETDKMVAAQVALYAKEGHPSECREGCSGCCHIRTMASLPEMIAIAVKYPDIVAEAEKKALEQDKIQRSGMTATEWAARREPCVFLSEEGRCRVYDARPLACRNFVSLTPASYCEPGSERKVVSIDTLNVARLFYEWTSTRFGDGWGGSRAGLMPSLMSDALRLARGGVYRRTRNQDRAETAFWEELIEATDTKAEHHEAADIVQIKSRAAKVNAEKGMK